MNPLRYRGYVYDTETGLYYLQSRYYDPVFSRFVNADDYISTGNNLLSKNAFAYCYNNPVVYSDDSGTIPWYVIGIIVVAVIGLDHLLAKYQPDGGFSVADEPRNEHARIRGLYAEGHGFEADKNGITICDTEVGLVSCTIAKKNVSFEPVDVFTAFATADLDLSGIPDLDISAVASIYSPYIEFTVPLGDYQLTIEAEAYIGGIGTGVEIDPNSGKFKITPPVFRCWRIFWF